MTRATVCVVSEPGPVFTLGSGPAISLTVFQVYVLQSVSLEKHRFAITIIFHSPIEGMKYGWAKMEGNMPGDKAILGCDPGYRLTGSTTLGEVILFNFYF